MRILRKLDELLGKGNPLSDTGIAKLTCHMEQLTQKKEQLNPQIAAAMQFSNELQTDILESEEIQDTIMEYVSIVKQRIESIQPTRCYCSSVHSNTTYKRICKSIT